MSPTGMAGHQGKHRRVVLQHEFLWDVACALCTWSDTDLPR